MRLEGAGHKLVGREPVADLGAVDGTPVERLDLLAEFENGAGDPVPFDGQPVVRPVQHPVLVQPGEQQLSTEAVVVADPAAGDGELMGTDRRSGAAGDWVSRALVTVSRSG